MNSTVKEALLAIEPVLRRLNASDENDVLIALMAFWLQAYRTGDDMRAEALAELTDRMRAEAIALARELPNRWDQST